MLNRLKAAWRAFWGIEGEDIFMPSSGDETVIMLGRYASSLLKNVALDAAFKKVETDLFMMWRRSGPKDAEAREHLYFTSEALAHLRLKLNGMVQNMLIEEGKLKKLKQA